MKVSIPGQLVERTLRESPERIVVLVERDGVRCVTRVLRTAAVPRHFGPAVRGAVTSGRGSFAALEHDVAMTLEGYQVAARCLSDSGSPPRWPRALDAGITADSHVYVTTSWIEGHPLHQLPEPLSSAARVTATRAILELVVHMHSRSVAYGDLKPANLVLRPDGGVSLIDLDTLREVDRPDVGAPSRDRTENWAAPEQRTRNQTWMGSDIWALAQVLRWLWGEELPPGWVGALAACRVADPVRRPSAASLQDHLVGSGGALIDHVGFPVSMEDVREELPPPGGTTTERVGAGVATERVVGGPTERVDDLPVPPREPRQPPAHPAPPPPRPTGATGCAGALLSLGKAALAVGALVLVGLCGGGYAISLAIKNQADEDAELIFGRMKVHKTDPAKNDATERRALATDAAALWQLHETPRTCAVRALSLVWDQRWHTDGEWSGADFDQASAAVSEPECQEQPEAALARGTLYAGACRRRDPTVISTSDCQLAITALDAFWKRLPAGEEWNWLRVEAAWQELRARSALVARFGELKNPEGAAVAAGAASRCAEAEAWLPFAPVNGPELVEECMAAAGYAGNVAGYLHYVDLRLASLPTDNTGRHRVLAQLYTAAGSDCADAKVTWSRRGKLVATGAPWCLSLGHLARRCPNDAAISLAEGSLGDNSHPWPALSEALAARTGPCLE